MIDDGDGNADDDPIVCGLKRNKVASPFATGPTSVTRVRRGSGD